LGFSTGGLELKLIDDHSPDKIKPFVGANCWLFIPRAVAELRDGELVDCFPVH
jgi:molybdopterin molybdotransferase